MIRERVRTAKQLNVIEPSMYCYITDINLAMRVDGLEYVGVS